MASRGMKGLLEWCKRNTEGYRDVKVTNMTTSWKDGMAFCALLHRFRPDLIDFDSLSKENQLYNNDLAFSIAEKELGIAALLDAEDMANMKVPDKLSVMTYLSQYYSCFRNYKPGEVPENPILNPENQHQPNVFKKLPSEESVCAMCGKHVHLVQRYFDGGKLFHRSCHRIDSLKNIRAMNYFDKKPEEAEPQKREIGDKVEKNDEGNVDGVSSKKLKSNETSSNSDIKPVKVSITDVSPTSGKAEPLRDVVNTATPPANESFKPKQNNSQPVAQASPRPRARTIRMEYDKDPENREMGKVPPVAHPRTKSGSTEEQRETDKLSENGYDSSLNPFELSTGSESDTTLSSSSSEDDDDNNPFADIFQKMKKPEPQKTEEKQNVVEQSAPASKQKAEKQKVVEHSASASKQEIEEKKETKKDKAKSLNPFENIDSEDSDHEDVVDHLNPFSPSYKEAPGSKERKKRAPAPPIPPSPNKQKSEPPPKRPPLSPMHKSTCSPPQSKPVSVRAVPSPLSTKSPVPVKPPPPARIKKQAPPRPTGWKETAKEKMEDLNRANTSDPKYVNGKAGAPKNALQYSPKSPAVVKKNPASPARKEKSLASPKMRPMRAQRAAPGYGYPLIKRKVSKKMSEEEISNEIKILDLKLSDLEVKGVKLEEMLRFAMEKDIDWTSEEDELLQEWFELVNKKNILLRMESDLVFLMQQQNLEQEHADIEFQLRKIFNKPDATKTTADKEEEEKLLKRLVEVVERRNIIVNSIEEERKKEAEEDAAYLQLQKLKDNPNKKKKKHKVKKMFSKRGKKSGKT